MCVCENHMDEHAFMCVFCMCATAQRFFIVFFCYYNKLHYVVYCKTTLNWQCVYKKRKERKEKKKRRKLLSQRMQKKYSNFRIKG